MTIPVVFIALAHDLLCYLSLSLSPSLSLPLSLSLSLSLTLTLSLTGDPLVASIARQFISHREEHDRLARLWTQRYAQ